MRISTNCQNALVWATRDENVSWANFGYVDIPSGTTTFVVVLAYCERRCPSSGQLFFYYAYMGSLYIVVDKTFPLAVEEKMYRPVNDTFLAGTTLTGQFKVLPHPSVEYRKAAVSYLKRYNSFLEANNIEKHGLMHATEMNNFLGYGPYNKVSFDHVVCKYAKTFCESWNNGITLALWLFNSNQSPELFTPDMWLSVALITLTTFAGPYPLSNVENRVNIDGIWTNGNDSRNHPGFELMSNKDCDGKAECMASAFYDLLDKIDECRFSKWGTLAAEQLVHHFKCAYMAMVMVKKDISVGKTDEQGGDELCGHSMLYLTRAPGEFQDGTFVGSCNITHGYWPPQEQTCEELFGAGKFNAPRKDIGGWNHVAANLTRYNCCKSFYGKDGSYVVSGNTRPQGYDWNPVTKRYDIAVSKRLASFDVDGNPCSFAAIESGFAKILKMPMADFVNIPKIKGTIEQIQALQMQAEMRSGKVLSELELCDSGKTLMASNPRFPGMFRFVGAAIYDVALRQNAAVMRDH